MEQDADLSSSTPASRPFMFTRVSRLPVPRTGQNSNLLKPSPSREKLLADPGVQKTLSRLRTPSRTSLASTDATTNASAGLNNGSLRSTSEATVSGRPSLTRKYRDDSVFKRPHSRPSSRQQGEADSQVHKANPTSALPETHDGTIEPASPIGHDLALPSKRKPRPSLTDRTIETLSQVPPSPSPRRSRSSFYGTENPIRSSSRPSSALGAALRPRSRTGNFPSDSADGIRPPSPIKGISSKRLLPTREIVTPSKRSTPTEAFKKYSRSSIRSNGNLSTLSLQASERQPPRPLSAASVTRDSAPRAPLTAGSKTIRSKTDRTRPSLGGVSFKPSSTSTTPTLNRSRTASHTVSTFSNSTLSPTPHLPRSSKASPTPSADDKDVTARKVSNSSSALREAIAKAKAARKSGGRMVKDDCPQALDGEGLGVNLSADSHDDPFNQKVDLNDNKGLLHKRIESARTDGRLNISAMGLNEVPEAVMSMYDLNADAASASKVQWYESVDLIRFVAADNEIEEIGDSIFPDLPPQEVLGGDEEGRGNQFRGLETLDFHGNLLKQIPPGIRRLERLACLNMSNNKLDNTVFDILCQLPTLRELKLAVNNLVGDLPESLSQLSSLTSLDLHGNALTTLPPDFEKLTQIKTLNLAENRFEVLPFEALSQLPMIELYISKNSLRDVLLPSSVDTWPTLQLLDITNNCITSLSANSKLSLPALRTFLFSTNRINALPDMSTWLQLLTIIGEDNKLSTLPDGLTGLPKVRLADFTGNDLRIIDERICLLENLETLRIAKNPLREKKLLNMSTDDLKRSLRERLTLVAQHDEGLVDPEAAHNSISATRQALTAATSHSTSPSTAYILKQGQELDLSRRSLSSLDASSLARLSSTQSLFTATLSHNAFESFPGHLSLIATTLRHLSLSHNRLSKCYLKDSLIFPNLTSLSLSANALTSLDELATNLSAPGLTMLDLSINRLSHLPVLREIYPRLTTLLAADNQIMDLNVDTIRGMEVVDLSNNDIGHLPPLIGRLGLTLGEGGTSREGESVLRKLDVQGNRFRVPRWELLEKGTDALLAWLRDRIPAGE